MKFRVQITKAFTLIEILVAMLILAIGLLGLAGLTVVVLRSNILSQQIQESTTIATDLVNRLRRVNYAALAPAFDPAFCDPLNVVDTDAADSDCAARLTQAGVADLDPDWRPLSGGDSCTVAGVLTDDTRAFDVVLSNLTAVGDFAAENDICAVIEDADFATEHYIRFYRVVDEGGNRRLVVGVLFRDRFQKWRMTSLDTRRFP
jgi:type IV pilus assembly protein PilV